MHISVYIISSIPKGKDDLKDLKPIQGGSLDNNRYTHSDNLATYNYKLQHQCNENNNKESHHCMSYIISMLPYG